MNGLPVGETLHGLMHAYKRALREGYTEAHIGLSVSQIRVLKGVARLQNGTAQNIADRMRQDKGRIARLIKSLAADGLIIREPHPEDSRSRWLRLSGKGQELMDYIAVVEARAGARMAHGLSQADMQRFTELAEFMITNLEQPKERL